MTGPVCSERRASQPLHPELWVGLELPPEDVPFPATAEAHFAYNEVARDYPKAISVANRIDIVGKLQVVATILALHVSRELGLPDARSLMRLSWSAARAQGPLPISTVTPETVAVVDDALGLVFSRDVTALVLVDLLRLIEGVRP
mgnify:FL=1|jgi:hypothetical protein